MKRKLSQWAKFHAPHLPSWLPRDWLGRYYAWKYITGVRSLTPEEIAYGQKLWDQIKPDVVK